MGNLAHVFHALRDGIEAGAPEVAIALLRAAGIGDDVRVELFEGDLSLFEALAYARMLREIGDDLRADELYDEVIRACFMPSYGVMFAGPAAVA
ncbi:MAG: hypothetical protein EP330_10730 [Deltaproteobacteria bacterium]|nr:MAG: hypothetical protein EP330_10730 [Deltaproteobacteria bacterium]